MRRCRWTSGLPRRAGSALRIPFLLPIKETGSTAYVRSLVYPSLRRFFQRIPPPRYSPCVLIFRHVYARARPERRFRDHDNIETNMVADAVALYTMEDDGPRVCSHYACTALGDRERTEVYVVPEGDFPLWLMSEKSMPEEGVVLLEKCPKSAQKDRAKWGLNHTGQKTVPPSPLECTKKSRCSRGESGQNPTKRAGRLSGNSFLGGWQGMLTLRPGSHVHLLVQTLAVTGEYPLCSLGLLGKERVLREVVRRGDRTPAHPQPTDRGGG